MSRVRVLALLLPCAAASLPACGYSAGLRFPGEIRSVAVPVFGNETFRRGVEFDLTEAVARAILDRTDLALARPESADAVLRGRVKDLRTPVLVEGGRNALLESADLLAVEVDLVETRSGRLLAHLSLVDRAEASTARGETVRDAFRESIADLAEKIVLGLAEKGRVGEPPGGSPGASPPGEPPRSQPR